MRVLITGADGFLGGAIAARLGARRDLELIRARRAATGEEAGVVFDMQDGPATTAALAEVRPDVAVHAAGRTRGEASELIADNTLATANLVEALALAAPGAQLVMLASAAQYGLRPEPRPWRETDTCAPVEPYGVSKQAAEQLAFAVGARAGLRVVSLRVFNVVAASPHGGQLFASFLSQAAAGPMVRLGQLGGVRDFIAIEDVARAAEAAIDREASGEAINVCTGVGRTGRELIGLAVATLGREIQVEEAAGDGADGWSIGDPARCEARLGFRPSADLGGVMRAAADWLEGARARSRA